MSRATPWVIGFGNPLRGDDGVGYRLAEQLLEMAELAAAVQVLACQQLTPDLAATLHNARAVLFVDATFAPPSMQGPRLQAVEPNQAGDPCTHAFTPAQLLSLTAALYDAHPPAWELLIPGHQWELREELSPATAAAAEAALPLLLQWTQAHA